LVALIGEFELLLFWSLAFTFDGFFFFLGLLPLPRGRWWALFIALPS
jgi:hypothetical protein